MNYQAIITDIKDIISSGQKVAYNATNKAMILTYWHVGKRIVEQEQNGNERTQYGQALIDALADELTKEYGKSFSKRNLLSIPLSEVHAICYRSPHNPLKKSIFFKS